MKRRLRNGMVPAINPMVDLYNAISLRYAVRIGGTQRLCRRTAIDADRIM
ncbi:hypothetical protein [Kosakonia oryziphila]